MMAVIGASVIAVLLLGACAPSFDDDLPAAPTNSAAPANDQSADPAQGSASPARTPPASTPKTMGAAAAFRAWLDLSRTPDAAAACAALSPELATRMIAELNERSPVHVSTCDEMIAVTAELYRALGQDAQVDISVQQETLTDATLFVTYLATGDCGTVVMTRPASEWTITEQSRECVR